MMKITVPVKMLSITNVIKRWMKEEREEQEKEAEKKKKRRKEEE